MRVVDPGNRSDYSYDGIGGLIQGRGQVTVRALERPLQAPVVEPKPYQGKS